MSLEKTSVVDREGRQGGMMKTEKIRKILKLYHDHCADSERILHYYSAIAELTALETEIAAKDADNATKDELIAALCGHRNSEGYDPDDPLCSVRCVSAVMGGLR